MPRSGQPSASRGDCFMHRCAKRRNRQAFRCGPELRPHCGSGGGGRRDRAVSTWLNRAAGQGREDDQERASTASRAEAAWASPAARRRGELEGRVGRRFDHHQPVLDERRGQALFGRVSTKSARTPNGRQDLAEQAHRAAVDDVRHHHPVPALSRRGRGWSGPPMPVAKQIPAAFFERPQVAFERRDRGIARAAVR